MRERREERRGTGLTSQKWLARRTKVVEAAVVSRCFDEQKSYPSVRTVGIDADFRDGLSF